MSPAHYAIQSEVHESFSHQKNTTKTSPVMFPSQNVVCGSRWNICCNQNIGRPIPYKAFGDSVHKGELLMKW